MRFVCTFFSLSLPSNCTFSSLTPVTSCMCEWVIIVFVIVSERTTEKKKKQHFISTKFAVSVFPRRIRCQFRRIYTFTLSSHRCFFVFARGVRNNFPLHFFLCSLICVSLIRNFDKQIRNFTNCKCKIISQHRHTRHCAWARKRTKSPSLLSSSSS